MARIETLQTGRAIREMNAQIGRLPEWLLGPSPCPVGFRAHYCPKHSRYFAALLRTHQGFIPPTQGRLLNYVHRVPLGVVAQITVSYRFRFGRIHTYTP